ncbi:MAG: Trm112 family protein [Pseudonocardiales bacterium]|nr:Trm112 family protein [Pseudonocardiales bacterium]MBV9031039.1 Trm112 family protein [Pseudonocardiales bacterium]MBV9649183.1 Trm112 family protein [Pseudonocardiales bacterium]MBW0009337.1 Trm112 family protein [Pseudonocardiales bacterium]
MAVDLDPALMEILACPCPAHAKLHSGTAADPEADALTCAECGRSFPVTDGIPVLLLDEALPETGPGVDGVHGSDGGGLGSG